MGKIIVDLRSKIGDAARPVVFYEVIPPADGVEGELEDRLNLITGVATRVDAINIPEIHEEIRRGVRPLPVRDRIAPCVFAQAIYDATHVDTVVNRVTVHEACDKQRQWLRDAYNRYGIRNLVLVGGESEGVHYCGPSVPEMACLAVEEQVPFLLGGITIAHRRGEADRVRRKQQCGLRFFTTQVLLDSGDTIRLLRELDGLDTRIFLSFTPVSNLRDLEFLKWLGVDIPADFEQEIREAPHREEAVERSLARARRILSEIFSSLSPQAPLLGLQIERITKRNSAAARLMLKELESFYRRIFDSRRSDTIRPGTGAFDGPSPRGGLPQGK